jgi:hypothetical protein
VIAGFILGHTDIKGWIRKHPYCQGDHCNAQQLMEKKEFVNTALKPHKILEDSVY